MSAVINTRADLEAVKGTQDYDVFMQGLRGSLTYTRDIAVYPEGYHALDYEWPKVNPVWESVEDMSMVERFHFTKAEVLAATGG